jgi:hypothetical protein
MNTSRLPTAVRKVATERTYAPKISVSPIQPPRRARSRGSPSARVDLRRRPADDQLECEGDEGDGRRPAQDPDGGARLQATAAMSARSAIALA